MKIVFDRALAALLLLTLLLPMAVIAGLLLIRRDGPVLFIQPRLGHQQRLFNVIKFRTMTDGRIHALGRFLRPLGLDELPQLINIIGGQMSFVGPRPLTMADVQRLGWDNPQAALRWSVLPGLIGPAQLNPVCAADTNLAYDLSYAERPGLGADLRLIAWAALIPLFGRKRVSCWRSSK